MRNHEIIESKMITFYSGKHGKFITARVEVMIDLAALARQLGPKAFESKAGKATLQGGAVKVIHDGNWRGARD